MSVLRFELKELEGKLQGEIDVLICSVSYEQRCRSVADNINPGRIRHALIAENENHLELHGDNAKYLGDRFSSSCERVMLDTRKPLKTADSLQAALESCVGAESKRVVVDITTFTREAFLILFKLLRECFSQCSVRYLYARAEEFDPGVPEEEKWLSKGVADVRSVLGFPGELLPSRRLHLIILVGREEERAVALASTYEPKFISLGYAEHYKDDLDPKKAAFKRVMAVYGIGQQFTFDCYDPMRAKAIIEEQVALHEDCNVVVAPLHTKFSTLGAALVAIENQKVQLCYAQAIIYNHGNYSTPGNDVYLFEFSDG